MRWRTLLLALVTVGILMPGVGEAQPSGKLWRIGYVETPAPSANPHRREALERGLRDLGYTEGRNLVIERRFAEGKPERLDVLAAELVRLKLDLIVAVGTQAILALKRSTSVIPIVMALSGDAVGTGLVASLARPGGNVTGLTFISPELSGKRLELLREAFPKISRVAVLWNPEDPPRLLEYKAADSAAKQLGLTLQSVEVRRAEDFDAASAQIARGGADAVIVFADPLTTALRSRVVALVGKSRLPAIYGNREFVDADGLVSYAANFTDLFRRAATYVDKILKGANPRDLPVEQPAKFELIVNLKAAKTLGLSLPQSFLLRADEVIP